jgi:hypothetical protein
MTLTAPSFIGFLLVTGALLACASSRSAEPLYAEYSLDASRHPESIDCFYGCLRSRREEFRDVCLTRCEGVVATTTATPCAPGTAAICRSYRVEEPEPQASCYDESDDQVGEVVFDFLVAGVGAALSDDDQESATKSRSRPERRSSAAPKPRPERGASSSPKVKLENSSSSSKSSLATKSKAGSTVTPFLRSKAKRH